MKRSLVFFLSLMLFVSLSLGCAQKQEAQEAVPQAEVKKEAIVEEVKVVKEDVEKIEIFNEEKFVLQSVELKRQFDYGDLSSGHLTV